MKTNSQPIYIGMNMYSYDQVVVTKKEIKMYNAENGTLESIINNLFKNEESKMEITSFKIDKR